MRIKQVEAGCVAPLMSLWTASNNDDASPIGYTLTYHLNIRGI